MDDIRALLDGAKRRLALGRFLRGAHLGFVGAGLLALFLVLLAKSSPLVSVPWPWVLGALMTLVFVAGFLTQRLGAPSANSLAILVDEKLALKERISTAMAVRERSDPFARAAVADAVAVAKDARTKEALRRRFAVSAPSASWIGPTLALVAGLTWWLVPQGDFFRSDATDDTALVTAKRTTDEALGKVERAIEQNEKLAEAMKKVEAPTTDESTPASEALKTPEELKRDAIKKMTELQRKLDDVMKSKDVKAFESLKSQLAALEPNEGPAEDLGKALKEGDFTKAKEALEQLQKDAAGKSDAEKKEIEAQIGDMAKQIGKLADNQKALQDALQKAGLDGKLANNQQALQQALQNAKNLTDAQKDAIQQAAAGQQAAAEQMKGLSKAMQQAAQQMAQGGQPQGGQKDGQKQDGKQGQQGQGQQGNQNADAGQGGGGEMQEMLGGLESMQQMMNAAEAAAAEAMGQCQGMGQGMGQMAGNSNANGDSQGNKQGWQGGRGRASGGSGAQSTPTPTGTKIQKEKVAATQGEIIMKQLIEGKTVAGQSNVQAEQVATEIAKSMEGSVTEEQIPTHLADVHKHYFGELRRYVEAKARGGEVAPPVAPPAAPPASAPAGDAAKK